MVQNNPAATPSAESGYTPESAGSILHKNLGIPILLLVILSMLTIPLPPVMLDVLFTFNIIMSLIVLMVCVHARRPLDFSIFPTVILISTLLRLGLNVASTRVILINGQQGPGAAGHVIESFGQFVIGGNYVVGVIVFAVLVIINFIVIIKGAERVSEVNARFTLDSLPGKQMAIDADLNAGFIDQNEAGERRQEIAAEAEFHGSMDGASKFIKGDAIAAIAILIVNLVGGFAIGMLQHGLSISEALRCYITLSLGDGLVAQIPSLMTSTATAVIITRVSRSYNLAHLVAEQMFSSPRVLGIVAVIIVCIGIIPGMPNTVFLLLAAITGSLALHLYFSQKKAYIALKTTAENQVHKPQAEMNIHDIHPPKSIELEIGYRLINLVKDEEKSSLVVQVKGIRKTLSQHFGFLIPAIYLHDSMDLPANEYCIRIRGTAIASADVMADLLLALNGGDVTAEIPGIETHDPTFGMPAVWIRESQKEEAEEAGYSVVESSTVVATHLRQTLIENAGLLLGHRDVSTLVDELKLISSGLVDELVPKQITLSELLKILRNLLQEQVPVKDFVTICETLAEHAPAKLGTPLLTQQVRKALGNTIVQNIAGKASSLDVLTLEPELESILQQGLQQELFSIEPNLAEKIHNNLVNATQIQLEQGKPTLLLVSPTLRVHLAGLLLPHIKNLHVVAYDEIPGNYQISVIQQINAK